MTKSTEGLQMSRMGSTPRGRVLSGVNEADLVRAFLERIQEIKSERAREVAESNGPIVEVIFEKGVF